MTTREELADLEEQHADLRREHREALPFAAHLLSEMYGVPWSVESVGRIVRERAIGAHEKGRPHR